ncbi:sugar phosphate isomerase/epimerase family protein [Plastoroseomonas arctica]|uniref:Sugar phosphate isomerase/epimerase n=1 Tax=Plastoroseomonas arctica TaxID=1509237 RepID=A0AAF1JZK1_9PROT|nr:sugar phosphate isomerase/epimerase family protein [Plastoroseomonas arctica]MBR0656860.1 sugar phosphate isomerase/epimerase [Plastoroseomonas arctica]
MSLLDRIGVDIGRKLKLEDAIAWAAANGVKHIDIQLDTGANKVTMFDDARCAAIRAQCEATGVHVALHTLSAVNVAEYSPFLADAVDSYMRAYIEVAPKLGAQWIVVHAGYHFTADVPMRMEAARDRLKRMVAHAEQHGALLLLENLNKEPANAEVNYLAHTMEEWAYFYDAIDSPAFALSFTANHAHLMPEGVPAWIDAIPLARVREVRLADCRRNGDEEHLVLGAGDFDFGDMFARLEGKGYRGAYTNAFGTLEDMQSARHAMVELARGRGVAA